MNSKKLAELRSKGYVFDEAYDRIAAIADRNQQRPSLNQAVDKNKQYLQEPISIYEQTPVKELEENKSIIKSIFCQAFKLMPNECSLGITNVSGWTFFKRHSQISKGAVSGKNYTVDELNSMMQNIKLQLFRAYNEHKVKYPKSNFPYYFAYNTKLSGITPHFTKRRQISHWNIQHRFELPFPNSKSTENRSVKDSLFEVVINSFGIVESILIKWKPIKSIKNVFLKPLELQNAIYSDFSDFESFIKSNYSNDSSKPTPETAFVGFQLAGENTFQNTLAPYLFIPSDDELEKVSLINNSLNISFEIDSSETEIIISAMVSGGSNKYQYDWLCWEIANPLNFQKLGRDSVCKIYGGALHVLLVVKDLELQIQGQFQQFFYANKIPRLQFPPTRPPLIYGCTNPKSKNYNPNANCDDGSCEI